MSSVQLTSVKEQLSVFPMGRLAGQFLDYLSIEAGLSENTILAYGRDLKDFVAFGMSREVRDVKPCNANSFSGETRVA